MSSKKQIYFVSDIHMGTDAPSNWYQSTAHDPFFETFLDHVLKENSGDSEVVILGDLIDLWTYPVDQLPPQPADVVAAHPNILGAGGKFAQLPKNGVKVSYVNGNHDMAVTKEDLALIIPGAEYVDGGIYQYKIGDNVKIIGMHGHRASIYNAPRLPNSPPNPLPDPLPLGYLMTRLTASYAIKRIKDEGVKTAADLKDNGDPTFGSFVKKDIELLLEKLFKLLTNDFEHKDIAKISMDLTCEVADLDHNAPLTLPNGDKTTIVEVASAFHKTTAQWVETYGAQLAKDALYKTESGDLDWIVSIPAARVFWDQHEVSSMGEDGVVVMGHTHKPEHAAGEPDYHTPTYWNSGFDCPSIPDMGARHKKKHVTFVKVDVDGDALTPAAYKIVHVDGRYKVNKMNMNDAE